MNKRNLTNGVCAKYGVLLAVFLAGCASSPSPSANAPSAGSEPSEEANVATAEAAHRAPQAETNESDALLLGGGCQSADQCTPQVCSQRQSRVHPTCDVQRSCSGNVSQAEAQRRLTINQNCLAAREAVAACYSVQDSGHQQQIENV